jgi:GNAT superfamily N-acetyltransferase
MGRELAAAWVDGWVVSRGTRPPRPTPWGLRVEVGTPNQHARYVMLDAHEPIVRDLAGRVRTPAMWIKAFVEPELLASWLTPDWTADFPGWLMAVDLRVEKAVVPEGYTLGVATRDGVTRVSVSTEEGERAAAGQFGLSGHDAVVDQVSTEPAHQRRGLGSVVLRTLANEAVAAGADRGILGATPDGRALYEYLGWKTYAPLAGFVYRASAR